jgi:hypothetical protein
MVGDLDELCVLVDGPNPRMATVAAGATAAVAINLTCIPPFGTVEVTTVASGRGATDPDGYVVTVGAEQRAIGIAETAVFVDVPRGTVVASLSGLASNCSIPEGSASRELTVVAGDVTRTTFDVASTRALLWMAFDDTLEDRAAQPRPHDGTFVGDATFSNDTPTGTGGSLSLDGVGDSVEIANAGDLDVSGVPYTIAVWVKTSAGTGVQPILAKSPVGPLPNVRATSLYLDDRILIYDIFGVGNMTLVNQPNQWRHIVVTHDGGSLFKMYFQGAVGTIVGRMTSNEGSNGEDPWRFTIGDSLGFPAGDFAGEIDDVVFFDVVLDDAEIAELFVAGPARL